MTYNSFWIYTLGPLIGGVLAGCASIALAILYKKNPSKI
jgi:glycerol uptake facilitator-like aquaporin